MHTSITDHDKHMAPRAVAWLATQPAAAASALSSLASTPPFVHNSVSQGFYGVARFHGGMKADGYEYLYVAPEDACIRLDVVRAFAELHAAAPNGVAPAHETA